MITRKPNYPFDIIWGLSLIAVMAFAFAAWHLKNAIYAIPCGISAVVFLWMSTMDYKRSMEEIHHKKFKDRILP